MKNLIKFSFSSLRSKILFNIIVFTLTPLFVICILIYVYMYNSVTEQFYNNTNEEIDRCAHLINKEMSIYIDKSVSILYNSNLQQLINETDPDEAMVMMVDFQKNMNMLFNNTEYQSSDREPFQIFIDRYNNFNGRYFEDMSFFPEKELAPKILSTSMQQSIWKQTISIDNRGNRFLVFYLNITNVISRTAIMQVNIPYRGIQLYLDNLNNLKDSIVIHASQQGHILNSTKDGDTSAIKDLIIEKDYLVVTNSTLLYNKNTITIATPKKNVYAQFRGAFLIAILIFTALITTIIVASSFTSKKITERFNSFINYLRTNDELLMDYKIIQIESNDEIAVIQNRFVSILRRLNKIYQDSIEIKQQNSRLEMELLQERINPHLLYNSLSVIKWDALRQNNDKTVEIVDAMSKFYRIALSKGNNVIEVSSELSMIKEYVRIVNYTHSNGYQLKIDCDERILKLYILKHLLQPVVENAILHGLNEKGNDGQVWIKGYMDESDIVFEIADNGYGMTKETVDHILSPNYASSYGGYGIKNLMKRLKLHNGDNYGIKIDSEAGRGTTVIIRTKPLEVQQS